MALVRRLTIRI